MRKLIIFSFIFCFLFLGAFSASAQSIDILWHGDGYTTPFYKGRGMWSSQTKAIFTAIPEGAGNPSTLYYRWIKNGTVLGSLSGVGRNSYVYTDSVLSRPVVIRVEVLAREGHEEPIIAARSVEVAPTEPSLSIYENSPLYGFMFNREVSGTYQLKGPEVTFAAFPVFFGVNDRGDLSLEYSWQTNTGSVEAQNSVTYRAPENTSGNSAISVSLTNSKKVLQHASKSFLVKFGN